MADERFEDKSDDQGEEEYRFENEQHDYDLGATPAVASVSTATTGKKLVDRFKQHRRIFAGTIVFLLLLGVVYRMIVPTVPQSALAEGEITQTVPVEKPVKKLVASVETNQPSQPLVAPAVSAQPQIVAAPAAAAPVATSQVMPSPSALPSTVPQEQSRAQMGTSQLADLPEKVAGLEQQNAAMANLLQSDVTKKLAESEAQNNQLRLEVQELTSRVTAMEVAFHQLATMLGEVKGRAGAMRNRGNNTSGYAAVQTRSSERAARVGYTVQAIIPGRAWLRSDSGDTVTVAVGDTLRGLGRITHIDPYDGVVNINTGSRTLTLSYGLSDDQA